MPLDLQDLNPEFARRLSVLLAQAKAQGVPAHVISGFRDNAQQAQLYANYQAKQAGRPIPFPAQGHGGVAAPPGGSYHNYGLAADVLTNDPSKQQALIDLARATGGANSVHPLGAFDRPHIQMSGNLAALRASPPQLDGGSSFDPVAGLQPFTQGGTTLAANLPPATPNVPPAPSAYGYASSTPNATPTTAMAGPDTAPGTTINSVPDASSPAPSVASLLGQGDFKGAAQAFADNPDLMKSLQGLGGDQSQGKAKSQTPSLLTPPPPLQTNQQAIAQQAPQLMAQLIAQQQQLPLLQRRPPGLSLGGYLV